MSAAYLAAVERAARLAEYLGPDDARTRKALDDVELERVADRHRRR